MIRGTVRGFEARVTGQIRGRGQNFQAIETIVDTGFDGWLSVPPLLLADLDLRWRSEGIGMLADGSESRFDIYEAKVRWHGHVRRIPVYAIGAVPLIGMALLNGSEFNMHVRPRGAVTIKPLRRRRGDG